MDSFEINKYFGALTGALMVFFSVTFLSEGLFSSGYGGHGEEQHLAFALEIDEGGGDHGGGSEATDAPSLGALLAAADVGAGERVFKKCGACHDPAKGGANKLGPALYGVVGRPIGKHEGFSYSDDIANHGGEWSWETLDTFLTKPKDFAPGTKMSFAGLKSPEDRANVMAYLNTLSDAPLTPPAP